MAVTRMLAVAGLALALAGCGDADRRGGSLTLIGQSVAALAKNARGDTPVSRITASDAALNAAEVNLLLVQTETTGSRAGFALDSVNGDAMTWRSTDGVSVVTRGGQLNGTAGFGFDLSSAALPAFRPGGTVTRTHYRLRGDEVVTPETFTCVQSLGPAEAITVTGRRFATQKLVETCRSAERDGIENAYWIDASGVVRKSRQWASPGIGYLVLEDVHGGLR